MDILTLGIWVYSAWAGYELLEKTGVGEKLASNYESNQYKLKLGYQGFFRIPIVVDMMYTPHMFVCGLSRSGKSKMVEYVLKNKDNVVILNAFEEDFTSLKCRKIWGNEKILKYLTNLTENLYKRETPLYVAIDEMLVLCKDKNINRAIQDLLAVGRHYNIFVIGVSQLGEKNDIPFKNLFNVRVCFRQVDESSYRAVLGYSPLQHQIQPRKFHCYADKVYFGQTYNC